jgi:methylenetetrahydrofolate reductase (NADPH)
MLRVFRNDVFDPNQFIVTLELVPGREHGGKAVDTVMGIAADAFKDGRISAVSITDNPGGNPSLSPDVLGSEIFKLGMDVIVHFTCRDMNRVGLESRALQLAMMGMKNILALTGDYAGQGFAGQGAPVFDLDSVSLQCLMAMLNERILASGDPDDFLTGCAVSPFKYTEGESFAQYAKLCRKVRAGAQYIITQLGYDARKFQELMLIQKRMGLALPTLGSVYILTPKVATLMNQGKIPGAVVPTPLLKIVQEEWKDPVRGRAAGIERAARLGVVLKGLGYRGIHIGGVHKQFEPVARILNRMQEIESNWREFLPDFDFSPESGFYAFGDSDEIAGTSFQYGQHPAEMPFWEVLHFHILDIAHHLFFNPNAALAPLYQRLCRWCDTSPFANKLLDLAENVGKQIMLGCRQCGDCAIQHVAFQCPESGCPKHTRNGACGGSRNGRCEVYPDRWCLWYRSYHRWTSVRKTEEMARSCIPPRKWELDHTSSWLNFHLGRDHQTASADFDRFYCSRISCGLLCSGSDQANPLTYRHNEFPESL